MNTEHEDKTRVRLLVGTRKGGLIFTSDRQRKNWQASELHFKSWKVMHMQLDPCTAWSC